MVATVRSPLVQVDIPCRSTGEAGAAVAKHAGRATDDSAGPAAELVILFGARAPRLAARGENAGSDESDPSEDEDEELLAHLAPPMTSTAASNIEVESSGLP